MSWLSEWWSVVWSSWQLAGMSGSWSPSSVTVPSNSSVQATFNINTAANTPTGTINNIVLQGTNGSVTHAAQTVSLTVLAPGPLPDLITSATPAGAASYISGQSNVQSQVTVIHNGGSLPVITAFPYVDARLYFSTDSTWDNADTLLWTSNGLTPDYQ